MNNESLTLFRNSSAKRTSRAFTLVELLVVVMIFSLITLLVLANNSRFNSSVLLGSLAYKIALSIRQAQVFGVSVAPFSASFQVGYGVHFQQGSLSYQFFADVNNNKHYDAGDSTVSTYSLGQGHTIKKFCGTNSSGTEFCSDTAAIDHLDIIFNRPNPDANISSNTSSFYSSGKIVVTSPSGDTRTVTVVSTGQISVTNP